MSRDIYKRIYALLKAKKCQKISECVENDMEMAKLRNRIIERKISLSNLT